MATWESTTPDVIDALVALWVGISDDVSDGPVVSGSSRKSALMVGWNDVDPEASAASGQDAINGLGAVEEQYTIPCTLKLRSGGSQSVAWKTQRDALMAMHKTALTRLLEDKSLGGLVMSAIPGPWDLFQPNKQAGRDAALVFEVEINALAKWSA